MVSATCGRLGFSAQSSSPSAPLTGDWRLGSSDFPSRQPQTPCLINAQSGRLLLCSVSLRHFSCLIHQGDLLKALKSPGAGIKMSPWHTQLFLMRTGLMWKLWARRGAVSCPSPQIPPGPASGWPQRLQQAGSGGKPGLKQLRLGGVPRASGGGLLS